MPDKDEFNLEDWWENDLPDFHAFDRVVPVDNVDPVNPIEPVGPSFSKTTAWGDVGTIGIDTVIPENELENVLASTFSKLKTLKISDEWFYVIRRCDHMNVTKYVQASEELLYGSKENMKMINGYIAQPLSELYFHMLRAYTRAEEGDFVTARKMWQGIHENWIQHANDYRKPFILTALYLTSLSTNEWEQAMHYLRKMWSIIKFMDGVKRYAFGIWDEWITCIILSWFFAKHTDYLYVFCKDYIEQSNPFVFQRKSIILENMKDSFITEVIPKAYYEKARQLNPGLPEIEYKEKKIAYL